MIVQADCPVIILDIIYRLTALIVITLTVWHSDTTYRRRPKLSRPTVTATKNVCTALIMCNKLVNSGDVIKTALILKPWLLTILRSDIALPRQSSIVPLDTATKLWHRDTKFFSLYSSPGEPFKSPMKIGPHHDHFVMVDNIEPRETLTFNISSTHWGFGMRIEAVDEWILFITDTFQE